MFAFHYLHEVRYTVVSVKRPLLTTRMHLKLRVASLLPGSHKLMKFPVIREPTHGVPTELKIVLSTETGPPGIDFKQDVDLVARRVVF